MTSYKFLSSIGRRFIRCCLYIGLLAGLFLAAALISRVFYLTVNGIAHVASEHWLRYAAHTFRILFTGCAAVAFAVASTLCKYKLFHGAHQDVTTILTADQRSTASTAKARPGFLSSASNEPTNRINKSISLQHRRQ